jgi:serine kinase of HPr protein (carbohydrate metabolism regulator)
MAEELTTLTVKEFIREMLKINIDYVIFLTNGGPSILNFKYNEELNRIQLLSKDNHNFLLDKNKINTRKILSKLLDYNLDAEIYYDDVPVVSVYENTTLRRINILLKDIAEERNLVGKKLDYIKMFSDKNYYSDYLKLLFANNIHKLYPINFQDLLNSGHKNWDDLLDV